MSKTRVQKALALQKSGKSDEAAALYRAVLKDDPENADAWHLLGLVAGERRQPEEALKLIRKALSLRPESPFFHHNLAGFLGQTGDLEAARSHFRKAIELKPDYAEAYYNFSGNQKFKAGDPVIAQVLQMIAKGGWSRADRCFLHFAAGKMLDDTGDHDRAMGHYLEGNAAKGARFEPEIEQRQLAAIRQVFTRELLEARAGEGDPSELPVFIVGMPRSGTSLAEQILASHPAVHGAGELPDIGSIAGTLPQYAEGKAPYPHCVPALEPKTVKGFAEAYLGRLRGLAPGAERVVDKLPLNFRHVGLIALMFPKARILHCRRDPLDTCLSCYFQNFTNGQDYAFDLVHLGLFYRWYRDMMAHWQAVLPGRLYSLDYEAVIAEPEAQARALLAHCGLDWHPACADSHKTARPVMTASRWQVRQPLYKTSVKRWQRYEKHLGPLVEALGDVVT